MTTMLAPVSIGVLRDRLDRIETALREIEKELSGRYIAHPSLKHEIHGLASRLSNLLNPLKGHAPGSVIPAGAFYGQPRDPACPCDGEKTVDPQCAAAGECVRDAE